MTVEIPSSGPNTRNRTSSICPRAAYQGWDISTAINATGIAARPSGTIVSAVDNETRM